MNTMNKYDYFSEDEHIAFLERERGFIAKQRQKAFEKRLGGVSMTSIKNQETLRFIEIERIANTNPFEQKRYGNRI